MTQYRRRSWLYSAPPRLGQKARPGRSFPGRRRHRPVQLGGVADVTARPDGTLAPVRSAAWLTSLEAHPRRRLTCMLTPAASMRSVRLTHFTNAAGNLVGVGYGSPLFNNSGCATEGFPAASASSSPTAPGSAGSCAGDIRADRRRHARVLAQALQRTERPPAVGRAVLLPAEGRLVGRCNDRHRTPGYHQQPAPEGHRQHGLHFVPLLPALNRRKRRLCFGGVFIETKPWVAADGDPGFFFQQTDFAHC